MKAGNTPSISKGKVWLHTRGGYLCLLKAYDICTISAQSEVYSSAPGLHVISIPHLHTVKHGQVAECSMSQLQHRLQAALMESNLVH